MKVKGKNIAKAFAATFENHELMDDGTAYHTICKGSLVVAAVQSMRSKDFAYFMDLVGITTKGELECYFEIGCEFDKLIEFSAIPINDIEKLAYLSSLEAEEIKALV